jgi:hypothetical protein
LDNNNDYKKAGMPGGWEARHKVKGQRRKEGICDASL